MSAYLELDRMLVGDAMHHGILTCGAETPLQTVAEMMADYGVHCVAVHADPEKDFDGELWGIVSDLDLVGAAKDGTTGRTAGATAATPVVTTTPDEPLTRAAQLMTDYAAAHLVVVDAESGRPVGILSTLDIARSIAAPL
jgi:CBS domain-containing protein